MEHSHNKGANDPRQSGSVDGQVSNLVRTPEAFTIDPKRDRRAFLAIAACLNGSMIPPLPNPQEGFVHTRPTADGVEAIGVKAGYKGIVLMELEDYFFFNGVESSQFSKSETLGFVQRLTEAQVLTLLKALGKDPEQEDADPQRWEDFVNALQDERYDDLRDIAC